MRAFRTQLEACLPDLWRYAFSLTRDRDVADDLVQDCVERALRKRALWGSDRTLRPWLMTMLLNIHRNRIRAERRRGWVPLPDEDALPATAPEAERRLELTGLLERVTALPEEQRAPLLLVVVGGMSYAETAASLDIPVGTVMSRIGRARAQLKAEPKTSRSTLRSVK